MLARQATRGKMPAAPVPHLVGDHRQQLFRLALQQRIVSTILGPPHP